MTDGNVAEMTPLDIVEVTRVTPRITKAATVTKLLSRNRGATLAELATISPAQLRQEWRQVHRKVPPTGLRSDVLARGIASALQKRMHGKLAPAEKCRLDRYATKLTRTGELSIERDIVLKPGTRLLREWGGERHRVLVLDEGFQHQDRHYGSLTPIAREITGVG